MDNNVIISIKGMQSLDGAENETVELVTEGTLIRDGDGEYTISYQESEVTGMEGTLTTFQIERGRVTLLRIGEFNSQMVFEQGRRHVSLYHTPYGSLSVGVNTREMSSRMDERGGAIRIAYDVEIDHALTGTNTFEISVREAGTRRSPV